MHMFFVYGLHVLLENGDSLEGDIVKATGMLHNFALPIKPYTIRQTSVKYDCYQIFIHIC